MEDLSPLVLDFALNAGAKGAGIATPQTLAGGPPSADLAYVLPGARAAITFALPLNQDFIEPYLAKKDHASHDRDNAGATNLASGVALQLAAYLEMKGHPSVPVAANHVYRTDTPKGINDELPTISHRYLAVASGVGHLGLSGNLIRPDTGAALVLASVVTQAPLDPTPPLPPQDNYCDECRLCQASCFSGFMHPKEKARVTLGGHEFTYARRRGHLRCDYVCGGFAGLHPSGNWSTWSPARFAIPQKDEDFLPALRLALKANHQRPMPAGGFYNPLVKGRKLEFTCCHCMLICHPQKEVRRRRLELLKNSGVVIQEADGSRRAVTPDQARAHLEAMPPSRRALYQAEE